MIIVVSIPVPSLSNPAAGAIRGPLRFARRTLHHDNASLTVKTVYALGYLVWLVSGRYVAPGCLILARKEPT